MFGLGVTELIIVLAVVALLFGPALAVAWLAWSVARSDGEPTADRATTPSEASDPAVMVARERYARGEITREEFEEIRATLGY